MSCAAGRNRLTCASSARLEMPPDAGPPQAPIERKPHMTTQAGVAHVRTVMSKASAAPCSSYIHLQQVLAGASKQKSLLVGLRVHVDVYVEVRAHSVKKLDLGGIERHAETAHQRSVVVVLPLWVVDEVANTERELSAWFCCESTDP
jgi:hypothetical protein